MVVWILTIITAYMIFLLAFKIDNKHNNGDFRDTVEELWGIALFCLILPIVNVILGLLVLGGILINIFKRAIEEKGIQSEDIFKKIFFIKEKR